MNTLLQQNASAHYQFRKVLKLLKFVFDDKILCIKFQTTNLQGTFK